VTKTAAEIVDGLDLSGRTAVVTGATSGLGLETARVLATARARVVIAGRGADRLAAAAEEVRAAAPDAAIETVELDLGSLESVRVAAADLRSRLDQIELLINNAGVMFTPFGQTADGFETQFGVNHLGHFEWTRQLLPLVTTAAAGARVVNLTSAGHGIADVDLDDPNWQRRPYDKFASYGASKTANILFSVALDGRLKEDGVRSNAVHPGMVTTNLARHMSSDDWAHMTAMMTSRPGNDGKPRDPVPLLTPEQGAATQVWAAVAPELADVGGSYLADCGVSKAVRSYALDPERAELLWALSEQLCG
jgi:NAD(P)-dependent dehydrogenase (short-subunit alcohol dehydrogenase family)